MLIITIVLINASIFLLMVLLVLVMIIFHELLESSSIIKHGVLLRIATVKVDLLSIEI